MSLPDHITQLRKGTIDLAILSLLHDSPRYGGEIVSILAAFQGLDASGGTVYPLLTRLRNLQLVTTTWEESPSGPPRKYYHLTPSGEEALADLRENWIALASAMESILKGRST